MQATDVNGSLGTLRSVAADQFAPLNVKAAVLAVATHQVDDAHETANKVPLVTAIGSCQLAPSYV